MKRLVTLAMLASFVGLGAYGCSDASEPVGPQDPSLADQVSTDQVASTSMDLLRVDAAMVMAQEANLGPVFQFTGSSDFADLSFFDFTGDGWVYGYVFVFRDKSRGSQTAGLTYFIEKCDVNYSCEWEEGFGDIPVEDVTFTTNSVRLSTNTSADENPDFFRFSGDGGPIDITWTSTSFFKTATVFNERSQYGDIKVRRHENSEFTSAMAEGSVFSDDIIGEGAFGSSKTSQIEISVGNVVAAASGSGHFTADGEKRTFSFHALQLSDGRVGGEWQRYNRGLDARAHGKVTCMSFNDDTAWMGGFSTKSTTGTSNVRWRVLDGGKGGSQDAVSLQFVGSADPEEYCWGQPDAPELIPIESGNVNIRR
jgi:hypothetical protein